MKKLIILLIVTSTLFLSCTDKNSEKYATSDFIDLEWLVSDSNKSICRDKYTDVLYMKGVHELTPIMKADGTCLTYTEWKNRKMTMKIISIENDISEDEIKKLLSKNGIKYELLYGFEYKE